MNPRAASLSLAFFLALATALTAPATAPAAQKISGKLSARGYTVIALAQDGNARTVRVAANRFRLRPPARSVTLHLRAPNGRYAGPVVVRGSDRGKRAILGVRAGARLGTIRVRRARGYARILRKLPKSAVDANRQARARRAVPIGAGNFGHVRSKPPKDAPRGDLDFDGITASIDIDDDGDLILDNFDRKSPKASASQFLDGSYMNVTTQMFAPGQLTLPVNANGGSTDAQIAAVQQETERMGFSFEGIDDGTGELDCGALIYCSRGGTGQLVPHVGTGTQAPQEFPECCDDDGDGFGLFPQNNLSLKPNTTDDRLRAGDVIIVHGTSRQEPVQSAKAVSFVYSTFPVLASYNDGQGNAATFSYPRSVCPPSGGPFTSKPCPSPVRAGPSGDVILRLEFWRPQRRRLESDPGAGRWMDVGGLSYLVQAVPSTGGDDSCPESAYSNLDSGFARDTSPRAQKFGLRWVDPSADRPASADNSFGLTLNLTQCLAANGYTATSSSPVGLNLWAFQYGVGGGLNFTQSSAEFQLQP